MELGSVGEFGLIDLIGDGVFAPEHIVRGIGDDCAVLPYDAKTYQLLSCDMLNEGIHFLLDKITPYQLGYKAVAVSLSDIAAMGGSPTNIVLSIGLTEAVTVEWWREFYRGVSAICQRYQVNIAGGDTTKSVGSLSINVTALGLVAKEDLRLRSMAKAGDKIFVTGPLGASRAGLELLWHPEKTFAGAAILLQEHLQPEPCCQEVRWLNEACGSSLHALNDISDGLASECLEIASASQVGAVLDYEAIPVRPETLALAESCHLDGRQWALYGGEDYQLVGTLEAHNALQAAERYHSLSGKTLHFLGEMTAEAGLWLKKGQALEPVLTKGYVHF